jgi:cytochrome c oxidase assembly factor 6
MGLFDYFSSPDSKRAEEIRKGAVAPDRTERKKCWEARDVFYGCLDKNNVIDSLNGEGKKTAEKQCANENKQFEQDCAAAWVSFFLSLPL